MKHITRTFLLSLVLWIPLNLSAQHFTLDIGDDTTSEIVILKSNDMTVSEAFEKLNKVCTGKMIFHDRKVIINNKTYFQFGLQFRKVRRTWFIDGRKMRLV